MTLKGEELVEENSSLNRENLEKSLVTQNHVTPLEDITGAGTQSMGLGIDWVTGYDADPSTADADLLIAGAIIPFADIYNQLE